MTHTLLDIGSSLVRTRREAGISQKELAERIGTSQQQIARWESSGYRGASLARTSAVAEALRVCDAPGFARPIAEEGPAAYVTRMARGTQEARLANPVHDLGDIAARIRRRGDEFAALGLARIGVFGSFALGEQTIDSDVDLLVEFSRRPVGLAYMEPPQFAEAVLGRSVDWVEPRLTQERIRERVLSEVIYVWEA